MTELIETLKAVKLEKGDYIIRLTPGTFSCKSFDLLRKQVKEMLNPKGIFIHFLFANRGDIEFLPQDIDSLAKKAGYMKISEIIEELKNENVCSAHEFIVALEDMEKENKNDQGTD